MQYDHSVFISPFTWRYGSEEMKAIFSEEHKRKLLRRVWIALARAEMKAGLVTQEQLDELIARKDDIDIDRASQIESSIHHDLMAEIKTYAEQCPKAGSIIHLGATSMDALDNADILRFKEALGLILSHLEELIKVLASRTEQWKGVITMAFTHIQPAEITTVGYRLSQTLQDLLDDREDLVLLISRLKAKGMKGAVGTSASYSTLVEGSGLSSIELETLVMEELGLKAFEAATQIYTRKQDLRMVQVLSSIACTLHKFSQDFRVLQSPPIGEFSEPFSKLQVGSSAMPFKRNPILSEKICSLARIVQQAYGCAWANASETFLERTLDDSANRRVYIPESFLALDEMLITEKKIVSGMNLHSAATKRLLDNYAIFASTERLLMELGKRGANRQAMHEVIRQESLKAWAQVQEGQPNGLKEALCHNSEILAYMKADEVSEALNAENYIGDAITRTDMVLARAHKALNL